MEFYLTRAFEIARLTLGQIEMLHAKEAVIGRALMPSEIQRCFLIPTLRDHFGIPEAEADQAALNERVRKELLERKIWPYKYDLSSLDIELIHDFDDRLTKALELRPIDFTAPSGGKPRFRSSV